jgi:uncharacterized membrane protein
MKLPTLAEIRKTVVAIVGLVALLAASGTLSGTAKSIVDAVLAVATALGVYVTPNGSAAKPVAPPAAP